MEVRVLGTTFNINAYRDEDAIRTTLLTGKVKISSHEQSAVLSPGQQLISSPHSPFTIDRSPDVDQVVAWRFGYFQFNNSDLRTVMHQLERWYDVKVVYEGNVSNDLELIGKIPREMTLTQVLNVLQSQQVHFRLEGHTIIVLP
jgi:ferric-dicitrate binding protein FerR (iron transport regulator)